MIRVNLATFMNRGVHLNVRTEQITNFLSEFKGTTEEVTAGLADIHLDDTLPSETVGLKYMSQLVRRD